MLVDGLDNKEDSNGGSLMSYSLDGVQQIHTGWSHVFPHETVVSVDYDHVLGHNGWRNLGAFDDQN